MCRSRLTLYALCGLLMAMGAFAAPPYRVSQLPYVQHAATTAGVDGWSAAEFPGGERGLHQYLVDNVHYPKGAQRRSVQGVVRVRFLVEADGTTRDFVLVDPVPGHQAIEQQTLRALLRMPRWRPAMRDGVATADRKTVAVSFTLKDGVALHTEAPEL